MLPGLSNNSVVMRDVDHVYGNWIESESVHLDHNILTCLLIIMAKAPLCDRGRGRRRGEEEEKPPTNETPLRFYNSFCEIYQFKYNAIFPVYVVWLQNIITASAWLYFAEVCFASKSSRVSCLFVFPLFLRDGTAAVTWVYSHCETDLSQTVSLPVKTLLPKI